MKMLSKFSVSVILFYSLMLITGCEQKYSPIEVAETFWLGVQTKNTPLIRKTLSRSSIDDLENMDDVLPVKDYRLIRTIIEGDDASVDTTVVIDGDEPYDVSLETILIHENNHWKIEYAATVSNISSGNEIARILGSIDELNEKFSNEMERSMEEFKQAVPEIKRQIKQAEEKFHEVVPEIKDKFEELIREIEESLKQFENNEKQTQQGTIEI